MTANWHGNLQMLHKTGITFADVLVAHARYRTKAGVRVKVMILEHHRLAPDK